MVFKMAKFSPQVEECWNIVVIDLEKVWALPMILELKLSEATEETLESDRIYFGLYFIRYVLGMC